MPGLELFLSFVTALFTLIVVASLSLAGHAVADPQLRKFAEWVLGASVAFLFNSFLTVLSAVAGGSIFGTTTTLLSLLSFLIGAFYLLRASFVLRELATRR